MKIRVDVCINEQETIIDSSFLERRESWLAGTGLYIEFILKGEYRNPYDFRVVPDGDGVLVTRHSWNRFFLNLKESGKVTFEVLSNKDTVAKKELDFRVVSVDVPLLFSLPFLPQYSISDIRFFANRVSESLAGGTRFSLFTPRALSYLSRVDMKPEDGFWKMHELILSILTERGLSVYVSPFDDSVIYTTGLVKALRSVLFEYAERNTKFNLIWDLSSGIWKKGIIGVTDSFYNRFGHNIKIATSPEMVKNLGGEGFAQVFVLGDMNSDPPVNETGTKILRIDVGHMDFFRLRKFAEFLVKLNWGLECVVSEGKKGIRRVQYSLGNAMYKGLLDAKK